MKKLIVLIMVISLFFSISTLSAKKQRTWWLATCTYGFDGTPLAYTCGMEVTELCNPGNCYTDMI